MKDNPTGNNIDTRLKWTFDPEMAERKLKLSIKKLVYL